MSVKVIESTEFIRLIKSKRILANSALVKFKATKPNRIIENSIPTVNTFQCTQKSTKLFRV